ncbi:GGDEF domain-containing protein [Cobetia amphilecti]|uniref:GGDEF domain-containing protein n=1 Tax=Cobetia amphilecti TaxID=1055104 RepID=UPI001CDB227C|nr:GGDEF domain-containing protein [Cobetia amphilecti]UBU47420.1 GGDEF domain-containing protein [Cobetia amphilecti]
MRSQKRLPGGREATMPAAVAAERGVVEGLIDGRGASRWRLMFPDTLETRYVEETRVSRTRGLLYSGIFAFVMYATFLISDTIHRSEDLALAAMLRLGGVCVVAMLVLPLVQRASSMRLKEWLMTALVINTMLVSAILLQLSRTELSHVDTLLFGFFPMVGNILFRLRFPQALTASLTCTLIMAGVIALEPAGQEGLELLAMVIFVSTTGLSLLANHQLEHNQRQVWLLRQRERLLLEEKRAAGQRLTREANCDALTGVFNRRHLERDLAQRWADLTREDGLAILMVDVDHFKTYNDHHGHVEGDHCLQQVAGALQAAIGPQPGMVVRYGGEEFLVLLESVTERQLRACAERIRRKVRALKLIHPDSAVAKVLTVSVGAVSYKAEQHTNLTDLVRAADAALYDAKHQGRDCCVIR